MQVYKTRCQHCAVSYKYNSYGKGIESDSKYCPEDYTKNAKQGVLRRVYVPLYNMKTMDTTDTIITKYNGDTYNLSWWQKSKEVVTFKKEAYIPFDKKVVN
jgi:hypothetical protein